MQKAENNTTFDVTDPGACLNAPRLARGASTFTPLPLRLYPHLPLRLPLLVCNDAYPVHSTPPPAGRNNASLTPAATPDSGPNCSPTHSPSRHAFPDIMASLDVQPRLMEARPDPDTPAQMRAAVARYLAANALKDKALSTASPSSIQPNNKSTPSPTQQCSNSCNPTPNPTQPRTSSSSCNPTPNPTQPRTSSSSCNPTPNPTQPRTSRPKEEWLEHLIHHFNLSKKKQKKEAQQEGSLGELLEQMCKMNIEKDMEATRQLKERAEEDLDLMAMMSLMTHQQETFPQGREVERRRLLGRSAIPADVRQVLLIQCRGSGHHLVQGTLYSGDPVVSLGWAHLGQIVL
ncbi:unnamed protein product [Boreogadus saida]